MFEKFSRELKIFNCHEGFLSFLELKKSLQQKIDERLKPRTPNEYAVTLALNFSNPTEKDLEELSKSDTWRTKTETFRGALFCKGCTQLLPEKFCDECGNPLGHFTTSLDLIEVPSKTRAKLEKMASELLSARISTVTILEFMKFMNSKSNPALLDEDLELILVSALNCAIAKGKT